MCFIGFTVLVWTSQVWGLFWKVAGIMRGLRAVHDIHVGIHRGVGYDFLTKHGYLFGTPLYLI